MDRLIKDFGTFSLWSVSFEGLAEFAQFVVKTNYKSHQKTYSSCQDEINAVFEQEQNLYFKSKLYAIKDQNCNYLGSIRLSKWSEDITLPITEKFGINLKKLFISKNINPEEVWHVGRLAVNREPLRETGYSLNQRSEILKVLMTQALTPICKKEGNVLLAECDERFLKMAPNFDLTNFELVGKPLHYLGSPAIPVMNTVPNLLPFLEKNKRYQYV